MSPERLNLTLILALCLAPAITMILICVKKECVSQTKYTCQMFLCAHNNVKRRTSLDQKTQGREI